VSPWMWNALWSFSSTQTVGIPWLRAANLPSREGETN
jgi:hypothetical protein